MAQLVNPIHYGDVVGLSHPGTRSRIALNKGNEFLHFKFEGGSGLIHSGSEVTVSQNPHQYDLLAQNQKWKLTTDDNEPLHNGSRVKLDPIDGSSKAQQQYLVYRLRIDPIEHVVFLMMENRSFFRVYGYMDPKRDEYVNYSAAGKAVRSAPSDDLETPDPPHEIPFVTMCINENQPDGYVKSYEKYHKERNTPNINDAELNDIMGYTKKGFLPALHKMEDFACICSQWYCSMQGPTWPNRMMALSGTAFGWKTTPEMNPNILTDLKNFLKEWHAYKPKHPQRTSVFDILKDKNVTYNVFTDSIAEFSLAANVFYPNVLDSDMDSFRKHAKKGTLPNFSFVEPNYINFPSLGFVQNDDHPPSNPLKAQEFIASVYETLRTSPNWKNTLFVISYDEHGGFFDPVIPPKAPVPDEASQDEAGTFAKFGARVPTVLVSPCVKHCIDDTLYDHTSVLKYVLEKWAPDCLNHLGARTYLANTLPVLQQPRSLDEFPPIKEDDFQPAREFRAQYKPDPVGPENKQPLHVSAAEALKDPAIETKLKAQLVENRLAKKPTESTFIAPPPPPQEPPKPAQLADPGAQFLHAVSEAADAVSNAVSGFLSGSFFGGSSSSKPAKHTHAPIPAKAEPAPPPPQATTTTVTHTVGVISQGDAERYADDMLRKIKQGVDASTITDPTESAAIMQYQLKALCMLLEKNAGSNALALTYINLLQVRSKKHSNKIVTQSKSV